MIKQTATVSAYVDYQQKAKTFWSEKVGFDIVADHPMGQMHTGLKWHQKEQKLA